MIDYKLSHDIVLSFSTRDDLQSSTDSSYYFSETL